MSAEQSLSREGDSAEALGQRIAMALAMIDELELHEDLAGAPWWHVEVAKIRDALTGRYEDDDREFEDLVRGEPETSDSRSWSRYGAAFVVATAVITGIVVAADWTPLIALVGLPVGILIAVRWMPR